MSPAKIDIDEPSFDYQTSPRIIDLLRRAYSTSCNPRNLEVFYYPPYNETLSDLVNFETSIGTLSACQQPILSLSSAQLDRLSLLEDATYNLTFPFDDGYSSGELGEDSAEGTQAPDNVAASGGLRRSGRINTSASTASASTPQIVIREDRVRENFAKYRREEEGRERLDTTVSSSAQEPEGKDSENTSENSSEGEDSKIEDEVEDIFHELQAGERSFETSATTPDAKSQDGYPDLSVCHTHSIPVQEPEDGDASFAWEARFKSKVEHHCFVVIGELKAAPSRALRGERLVAAIDALLKVAVEDLEWYLAVYFDSNPRASSVIAIPGAGAWWTWKEVKRTQVSPSAWMNEPPTNPKDVRKQYNLSQDFSEKFKLAKKFRMGTEESDSEWTKLRKRVYTILRKHKEDFPNMTFG